MMDMGCLPLEVASLVYADPVPRRRVLQHLTALFFREGLIAADCKAKVLENAEE